jgi:hypothetical protein
MQQILIKNNKENRPQSSFLEGLVLEQTFQV